MTERILNVLFLCTGNSARSIMAEAILSREGLGRFKAFSAGSQPRGEVHPFTLHLLERLSYDTSQFRSKSWEEFSGPVWPGQPMTANWGVPDPAAVVDSEAVQHAAFFDTYRMLFNRISLFTNLPFEGLDKLSLQNRLNRIGKDQGRADSGAQGTPTA